MNRKTLTLFIRMAAAIIATAFGLITIWVGGIMLFRFSDPGYVIFLPLLVFNTAMGSIYTGAGILIWRQHPKAIQTSKIIFGLNTLVLILIILLYWMNYDVAFDSLIAMTLRTAIWLIIWWSILWIRR